MLYLGIDGGQSSSKCVLVDETGRVLGQGVGAGVLHLAAHGGREQFTSAMREAIQAAFADAVLPLRPVHAVGLGLSGVETPESPEAHLAADLLRQIITADAYTIENDGVAALIGAHLGAAGLILIAGTGSIAIGLRHDGQYIRTGGWGWLVGDEGSAVWIGMAAVRAVFHALDGMAAPTRLTPVICDHFSVDRVYNLKRMVYAGDFGARGFAALAPFIGEVAAAGDRAAQEIIRTAGRDLARMAIVSGRKLDFGDLPVPLSLIGGVWDHVKGLKVAFLQALRAAPLKISNPQLPPQLGAALLAMQSVGANLPSVFTQKHSPQP
ncbi:MAG: BadF/BadG/BcrA/BcrD ATPase family protein [Anaerolineae bacterium]